MKDGTGKLRTGLAGLAVSLLIFVPASVSAADLDKLPGRALGTMKNLVGRDLNGTSTTGIELEGRQVESVSLHNVQRAGETLSAVWLDGGELQAVSQSGRQLKRWALVGAEFEATLDDGMPLSIRIDAIERAKEKGLHGVYRYLVTYADADGERQPLCGRDDAGLPVRALPLAGRWNLAEGVPGGGAHVDDPDAFTFACEGYTLAKCVEGGYPPWREVLVCEPGQGCERTTLAAHHQACTRLLRADYCGDGASHTHDHVWINMVDGLGIRVDEDAWAFEAEWDEAGATCMRSVRNTQDAAPACFEYLQSDECGDPVHFDQGSLLYSEVTPE